MRRRSFLTAGAAVGLTFLAGCSSSGPDAEPAATETDTPTADEDPGDTPGGDGGLSAQIEPSASDIAWGEDYSVTVTLVAGDEYGTDWTHTEINWRSDDTSGGVAGTSYSMWNLPTGQPDSHTFEIVPPTTGEITFVLEDALEGGSITEWTLTVEPPMAAFGESVQYYDGLEVTMDVRLTETIEAHIYDDYQGSDLGVYSIRPAEGKQWALATVGAKNNSDSGMFPPEADDVAVLAGGNQLERATDLLFATQQDFRAVGGNPADAYIVQLDAESGYYDPPSELSPTAATEGWVPYFADVDAGADDVAVLLTRDSSSAGSGTVTARWE